MTKTISKKQIKTVIDNLHGDELIPVIEEGFLLYSKGMVNVPPVGHLNFENPPGDVHIKYGYINNDDYYVIKIASGFYKNPSIGLSSSNGMMLIFSQETGEALAILQDEGYLTDLRTAIAGSVAAKYLAPFTIHNIGIIGTGIQARFQLYFLRNITTCRNVIVWGRNSEKIRDFQNDPLLKEFTINEAQDVKQVADKCNLIVTATASREPLLFGEDIKQGTHITAVGADAFGKQELCSSVFRKADIIVADSRTQCIDHGDISYAVKEKVIDPSRVTEIGEVIANSNLGRINDEQISVADLTGVAVQDIQIAKYVYYHSKK